MRGQLSIEFLIVLTGMLLILASVTIPLSDRARADAEKVTALADAREAAGTLANALNSVYASGVGSKQTVEYWLPKGTVSVTFVDDENRLDVRIELALESDNRVQVSTILPSETYAGDNYVVVSGSVQISSSFRTHHRTELSHDYDQDNAQPRQIVISDEIMGSV